MNDVAEPQKEFKDKNDMTPKELGYNRKQRREVERANAAVQQVMESLCQKFYDFYMDNDPESEAVAAKQKELSAKWKVYCQGHNIKPEFHGLLDDYCKQLIEKYQIAKG